MSSSVSSSEPVFRRTRGMALYRGWNGVARGICDKTEQDGELRSRPSFLAEIGWKWFAIMMQLDFPP